MLPNELTRSVLKTNPAGTARVFFNVQVDGFLLDQCHSKTVVPARQRKPVTDLYHTDPTQQLITAVWDIYDLRSRSVSVATACNLFCCCVVDDIRRCETWPTKPF